MNLRLGRLVLLAVLVLPLQLSVLLTEPGRAWAGPVSWVEVPPTAEGRQWWDEGSLRRNRAGRLTVLSRFQAAPDEPTTPAPAGDDANAGGATGTGDSASASTASARTTATLARLYVMELDCDQSLYRDISVNGLPRFGASWQPTGRDDLTAEVLRQACAAEAA